MTFLRYIALSALAIASMAVNAQQSVVIDNIIAKVDDHIVLKSDLEKAYIEYISRGEFQGSDVKCQILERLIVNKMMLAQAEIDSVIVNELEVQASLDQRVAYMVSQIGSENELERRYGKSMAEIKAEIFDDLKDQMTVQRMQQQITSDIKVSPAEVKRFFNKIPADSLPFFSTEVEVAQIVVIPKAGKKEKAEVERQMHEIKGRILKGESFANLARTYSEDPGSAANGGQLPFYKRGDLAPEFEATAMTLAEGELSEPVESQFGFHLIELQKKRGNTFRTRHILMMPKPSGQNVSDAKSYLDSLRTAIVNDSITFQEAAKEYSDDKFTASNGGFFTDQSESLRVPVDQLDPNIFFTLDTMTVGTITAPLEFQQADGTRAFRILYYKKRLPPHLANLKDDYQKIAMATMNNKQNQILSKWFDKARGDIYIEIDPAFNNCNLLEQ